MSNFEHVAPCRRSSRSLQRQHGVALIELSAFLFVTIFCMACMLQIGQGLVLHNVDVVAASSAGLHLATVPTAEAIDLSKGKAKALEIVQRIRVGAAVNQTTSGPATLIFCTAPGTAPCGTSGSATSVSVRLAHLLGDNLMSPFTATPDFDIATIQIKYTASYPRVGFM